MKTYALTDLDAIAAVIRRCNVCFVGFSNPGDAPYVIPMNFVYADGYFYLHSGPSGHKYDLLRQLPKVSITLSTGEDLVWQHPDVACSYSMRSESVLCNGTVEFLEDPHAKAEVLNLLMKGFTGRTFSFSAPALAHVCVWRIKAENLSCRSFGNSPKRMR